MKRIMLPIALLVMTTTAGCSHAPKYTIIDTAPIPPTAKVGVVEQIKCASKCTTPDDPKIFTETLRVRLEELLRRPVMVVPAITKMDEFGYYTPDVIAESGKAGGVDYVVDAQLSTYRDPSSSSRAGATAVTAGRIVVAGAATAALGVVGVPLMFTTTADSTNPAVSAYVSVIRTVDAKLIGKWNPDQKGGNFSKCTSLTTDIADKIYDEQFEAR